MRIICLCFITLVLTGCSTRGEIKKVSESESEFESAVFSGKNNIVDSDNTQEKYRIFHQAASGFVPVSALRNTAKKRIDKFCRNKTKSFKILEEHTSNPPHVLGNFPRIEIVFVCSDKPATFQFNASKNKYDQLIKLNELLNRGIITQEEFDAEKAKILNQ